jgi:hypothetical protein
MKSKHIIFGFVILLFSCVKLDLVHDYNYKTIIDERQNKNEHNHFNNKSFEGLCEIQYGFLKCPKLIKAYNADGTLIVRCGMPFTFFIDLNKINRDIEYIKFDSIELVTKSRVYDLSYLKNISYQTYIYYDGERKEKGYGSDNFLWEKNDFQILKQLTEEHAVSIAEMRSKGTANIEERIQKSTYKYNEEEKNLLLQERRFDFRFRIEHFPINVDEDEEVTVTVSLLFMMSNGSIEHIRFSNVYFREYSVHSYFRHFPIELYSEEKDVKL